MANYKILFIDENSDQIESFEHFFENIKQYVPDEHFEILGLTMLESIDELLSLIIDKEIDCVAFDYKLMENNSSFEQQGDMYQRDLLEHFSDFPTIILTNNIDDSDKIHSDPFKIVSKEIINFDSDDQEQLNTAIDLVNKICHLITNYREIIDSTESKLLELMKKYHTGVPFTTEESKYLLDLDSKMENFLGKKFNIPQTLKNDIILDRMNLLLDKSEAILNKLKNI